MGLLNLNMISTLKGKETKKKFMQIANLLVNTRIPLYLTGPSGSGKSAMAMSLAKWYAEENKVPAYYIQLSPDQTKTSVILGLRMIKGSLVPSNGVVADCMESGGICIVDEATHSTQELLLMFNGILDRTSVTSIGDKIIHAKDSTRFIFCSNDSDYAGNVKIPQSFAQRIITLPFNYPPEEEEALIAKKMVTEDISECVMSNATIKYVTSIVREHRSKSFPLSVRNIANAIIMMQVMLNDKTKEELDIEIEKINKNAGEAKVRKIYQRIYNKELLNFNSAFNDKNIKSFFEDVANIGIEQFKECILSSCMYYIDIEGFGIDILEEKEKLKMSILSE